MVTQRNANIKKKQDALLDELYKLDPTSPEFQQKLAEFRASSSKKPNDFEQTNYQKSAQKQVQSQFEYDKHKDYSLKVDEREVAKQSHMKRLNGKLGTRDTDYNMIASDIGKLAPSVQIVNPGNSSAQKMASDLDHGLALLMQNVKASQHFKQTLKQGKRILRSFDISAKNLGIKVPEREVDQLAEKQAKNGKLAEILTKTASLSDNQKTMPTF